MTRCSWAPVAVAFLASCSSPPDGGSPPDGDDGGGDDTEVPVCSLDTDGNGVADCDDPDDDGDQLSDEEEATLGTDPLDADSDRDGLSDFDEVRTPRSVSPTGGTTHADVATDPIQPTLLVEVDWMTGHQPSPGVIEAAKDSFAAAGIEAYFYVASSGLALHSPLAAVADMEAMLSASRSAGFEAYVHVVIGALGSGTKHGTSHYAQPNDGTHGNEPNPDVAGALVFAQKIADEHAKNSVEFGKLGITADHLITRTFVHELGHLIGCSHEGGANGKTDATNVMIQNGDVGAVAGNGDAWKDATLGDGWPGYPTFTDEAQEQIDLAWKVSVETATSTISRYFDMGMAGGPVAAGYYEVTTEDAFDAERAYGWEAPPPTLSSTLGSDATDDRKVDYVAGDPGVVADTSFRIANLGIGPTSVVIRLGATVTDALDVKCEMRHPEYGVSSIVGTIDAGNPSVERTKLANPVFTANALGFGQGDVRIVCRDGDGVVDAPIEFIRVTKNDP